MGGHEMDFSGLGYGQVAGSCKRGNFGFHKMRRIVD